MSKELKNIFRKGSKTYFNSSLFFPAAVRDDVVKLYAFVRTADDLVDQIPNDPQGFLIFANRYREGLFGATTGDRVIDSFIDLSREYCFDPLWAEAFLGSMEKDLYQEQYWTMQQLSEYMYGSAEVIGLFMSRILGLSAKAHSYAKMQGRAMQLINFIRDIHEDHKLGREYLPQENRRPGLLIEENARRHSEEFVSYIVSLINIYRQWQKNAEEGYGFIPNRYRIPIKTAADMYWWTAHVIEKDPFVVFHHKVKPGKLKIFSRVFFNTVSTSVGRKEHAR